MSPTCSISLSSDDSGQDMFSARQINIADLADEMECRSPESVGKAKLLLTIPDGWNLPGSMEQATESQSTLPGSIDQGTESQSTQTSTRQEFETYVGSSSSSKVHDEASLPDEALSTMKLRSASNSTHKPRLEKSVSPQRLEVKPPELVLRRASSMHSRISRDTRVSEDWRAASESLILFDWDDTLCPTTACQQLVKSSQGAAGDPLLRTHAAAVSSCLHVASSLGRVVIVTMAQRCWVNSCIAKLMPDVAHVLKELKIEIVCARESMTQRLNRLASSDDRNPSQYLKTKAMERIIKSFYKAPGILSRVGRPVRARSWKNVVSIGDSVAERLALQDLVFRHSQRGRRGEWKECRCKTLLLVEEPSLAQITKEVEYLPQMLRTLVNYDGDFDGDMHMSNCERDLEAASAPCFSMCQRP